MYRKNMNLKAFVMILFTLSIVFGCLTMPAAATIKELTETLNRFGIGSNSSTAAKTGTVHVNTNLNVRSGPWGDVIGTLNNAANVEIIAAEGEWLKIKYNGGTAYVHSSYVNVNATGTPQSSSCFSGSVTARTGLNVRSGPWGAVIGLLNYGTPVTVKGKTGEWYVITYNGRDAYVHVSYIASGSVAANPQPGNPQPSQPSAQPARPPVAVGGFVFPVQEYCSFSDRSYSCHAKGGSPFNQGVDIFGKIGLQLYACKSGRISSSYGYDSTGGNRLHVVDGSGNDYYYAHLNGFANVRPGMNVSAGTVVGYLGKTGNAAKTDAHLHFSMVDGGNRSVDPTSLLRSSKR